MIIFYILVTLRCDSGGYCEEEVDACHSLGSKGQAHVSESYVILGDWCDFAGIWQKYSKYSLAYEVFNFVGK